MKDPSALNRSAKNYITRSFSAGLLNGRLFIACTCIPLVCLLPVATSHAQQPELIPFAKEVVDSLSSPYFGGRGYGDNGDSLTAAYLEAEYRRASLQPLLSTFQQHFPLTVNLLDEEPLITIDGASLRLGLDFLPATSSPSMYGDALQTVYVGHGLYLPDLGYDDYQNMDVQGRIVMMDEAIPDSIRNNKRIPREFYSMYFRTEIAAQNGARAVFFIREGRLIYGPDFLPLSIPAFTVQRVAIPPEPEQVTIRIQSRLNVPTTTTNVIGYRAGTTYPNRYIVFMGHYDHLGKIGPNVHFAGANDNASGIALMLNLAHYAKYNPLQHSLVFIAFSGEEQGLVGSKYFVDNPPIPLEQIQFLINLDMVASGREGIVAVGGRDFEDEFDLLSTLNDSLQIGPLGRRSNAPNSDHFHFLNAGVRGFFLYTNKGSQPYHHIEDTPSSLDWDEFEDTYQLVKAFIEKLDEGQ